MADDADITGPTAEDPAVYDEQGPLRYCAQTRVRCPREDLIRFVPGPDGVIVPDLAEKLPGRGIWITGTRAMVEAAVRSKAFSRSLKKNAVAGPDLPSRLESLMLKRSLDALSIANKAGLITTGFTKVEAAVSSGGVVALIHAADGSDEGTGKLDRRYLAVCRDLTRQAVVVKLATIEQLSLALGRSNVVHAALGSGGAADKFLSEIARLERYRGTEAALSTAGHDELPAPENGLGSR